MEKARLQDPASSVIGGDQPAASAALTWTQRCGPSVCHTARVPVTGSRGNCCVAHLHGGYSTVSPTSSHSQEGTAAPRDCPLAGVVWT